MDYSSKKLQYYGLPRPEMIPIVPDSAIRILEVGCGDGQFGAALKQLNLGRIVDGIEPFEVSAQLATQVLDAVFHGSVEAYLAQEANDKKFDCIVFNDVLEHLYDPWQVVKDCRKILKEGGCIVCSIPNVRYFGNLIQLIKYADWKYTEFGILDFTHIRFFTRKSMIEMFQNAGYHNELVLGINSTLSPKYKWFELITLNRMPDVKFQQFAIRATLK
jgi:2-polyprenyl-3-methyl-5-hydroxy-6-metoxy-1,4-benzoquinol methylase